MESDHWPTQTGRDPPGSQAEAGFISGTLGSKDGIKMGGESGPEPGIL